MIYSGCVEAEPEGTAKDGEGVVAVVVEADKGAGGVLIDLASEGVQSFCRFDLRRTV